MPGSKYLRHLVTVLLTMNNLNVCEIFKSIQGESTFAGCLCTFVRLSGCNLRCTYCDTTYAFTEGTQYTVKNIIDEVVALGNNIVEITGGEPLYQNNTGALCNELLHQGFTVLVETNGSYDISAISERCHRIIDVKCPGSGMCGSFLEKNFDILTHNDELKFVISDKTDFDWALLEVTTRKLYNKATILFSPNMNRIKPADLAAWIVDQNAPVRLGIQLHKVIWGDKRGV